MGIRLNVFGIRTVALNVFTVKKIQMYHKFHTGDQKFQYKYTMKCLDDSNISVTELE